MINFDEYTNDMIADMINNTIQSGLIFPIIHIEYLL